MVFCLSLLQEIAQINEDNLTAYNRCALFALGAAYLNLISQLITVPTFCQHIHEVRRARAESLRAAAPQHLRGLSLVPCLPQVIQMRQKEAPYLLPEDVFVERPR